MKCIRIIADGTVTRIGDFEAHNLVKSGEANYCPKREWREETRDKGKRQDVPEKKPEPPKENVAEKQPHVHLKAKERNRPHRKGGEKGRK